MEYGKHDAEQQSTVTCLLEIDWIATIYCKNIEIDFCSLNYLLNLLNRCKKIIIHVATILHNESKICVAAMIWFQLWLLSQCHTLALTQMLLSKPHRQCHQRLYITYMITYIQNGWAQTESSNTKCDSFTLGQKKKLLYWRNPTDPKIRPDPKFFFKTKKTDKKTTDRFFKAKPVIFFFFFFLILRDGAPWKNGNSFKPKVPNSEYGGRRLLAVACRKIWCEKYFSIH